MAAAGTWSDDFSAKELGSQWRGDRDYFSILDGALNGLSATPVAPAPLHAVEVGGDWDNYVVQCRINVMVPNLLVCTKGALILRHSGNEGYVFALHVATKTVEVYRLSDHEMLLSKPEPLELRQWYRVRAELQGEEMSFYVDDQLIGTISDSRSTAGAIGLAVQDAESVLFDDFSVSGPSVNPEEIKISTADGKITLAWPTSVATTVLQSTDSLIPPVQWTTLTNAPAVSGNQNVLVLDMVPGARYFRFNP